MGNRRGLETRLVGGDRFKTTATDRNTREPHLRKAGVQREDGSARNDAQRGGRQEKDEEGGWAGPRARKRGGGGERGGAGTVGYIRHASVQSSTERVHTRERARCSAGRSAVVRARASAGRSKWRAGARTWRARAVIAARHGAPAAT
ncbi:hypothetical protein FGB62_1g656 [Gracilaria domingensis]|nr:hypothetical protein FGB62_1g656 [Gracilaria domingensis]